MVEITECDLPGIGKKYTLESTKQGDKLVLLLHDRGTRDIYFFEKKSETPTSVITLSSEEAKKVSAILEGVFFRPTAIDHLELVLSELIIEWIKVTPELKIVNKSIGEMEVRKRTGVSIIAIIRKNKSIPNPTPDNLMKEGDTLLVIGTREQFQNFQNYIGQSEI
ncbi:MAG: cation:proton antiporter regulatory subunit [Methanosarcinales archaeon]